MEAVVSESVKNPMIKLIIDNEVLPSTGPTQQVATKTQGHFSPMGKALGSKCDLNFPKQVIDHDWV